VIYSILLWLNKFTRVLQLEGYIHSPADPCVMIWIVKEITFSLLCYVDDSLLHAVDELNKQIEQLFLERTCIVYHASQQYVVLSLNAIYFRAKCSSH
jgi:hypothetical protein